MFFYFHVILQVSRMIVEGFRVLEIFGPPQLKRRSSRPRVFCKMVFLKVLKKFTVKHLCRNLLFNKSAVIDISLVRLSPRHVPGAAKWQLKKTNEINCFTNFEFYNFIIQSYMS